MPREKREKQTRQRVNQGQTRREAGRERWQRQPEKVNKREIGRLTKTSKKEKKRDKESMSCPTRAEYIIHISKGWALKINPFTLSLHDLT